MFRNRDLIVRLGPKKAKNADEELLLPEETLDPDKIKDLVTHTAKIVVISIGAVIAMRTASEILINASPKR